MVRWHIWSVARKTFKRKKYPAKYSQIIKKLRFPRKEKKTKNIWEFINNWTYLKKKIIGNPSGKSNIETA